MRKLTTCAHKQHGGDGLDDGVSGRNWCRACPALAAKHKIGNNGNVLERGELAVAVRAKRTWSNHGKFPRHSVDHDVEKRANRQTKNERIPGEYQRLGGVVHGGNVARPS